MASWCSLPFWLILLLCIEDALSVESGTLYGVCSSPSPPPSLQFCSIDVESGNSTNIGNLLINDAVAQQLSSIDNKNQLYYLLVQNWTTNVVYLSSISLSSGKIQTKIELPYVAPYFVGYGQTCDVDPFTGDVIVSGLDPQYENRHHIIRVNPKTGKLTTIAVFSAQNETILGATNGLDPKYRIEWIEYFDEGEQKYNLYGIDVDNKHPVKTVWNYMAMESMTFDPMTELIWGIGYPNEDDIPALMTFNSSAETFTLKMMLPQYSLLDIGIATLNVEDRIMYSILREVEDPAWDLLVGIDMETIEIISNTKLCQSDAPDCPWSLEMYN